MLKLLLEASCCAVGLVGLFILAGIGWCLLAAGCLGVVAFEARG